MTKTEQVRRELAANPQADPAYVAAKVGAARSLVYAVRNKLPKTVARRLDPPAVTLAGLIQAKALVVETGSMDAARSAVETLALLRA